MDGIDIQGSNVTLLRGIIRGCAGVGVSVFGDGNTIERVTVDGSPDRGLHGFVVFGDGNTLRSNLCRDNVSEGIRVSGDGSLLERNYCLRNLGDGIAVRGAGNWLISNISHRNDGHGIFAPGQNNSNGRNYATQNLTPPQCLIGNSSDTRC